MSDRPTKGGNAAIELVGVETPKKPARESAALPRPRTRCIYCGSRIPGTAPRGDTLTRLERAAARLACRLHRGLVKNDPYYNARPW